LAEVWTELAEPGLEARHCGGCGAGLRIVAGARVVVCEACGTRLDAATPEQPCSGCGARITFPEGAVRASCPACRTEFGLATGLS
jgi:predicted RNA-binding Zn-ribbon protein involved in translation (DUF1610 family)